MSKYDPSVETCVRFVNSIKVTHGNDTAQEIVTALEIVLGKAFTNEILRAVVTGDVENTALVIYQIPKYNGVRTIKLIREFFGCSLRESKEIVDGVVFENKSEKLPLPHHAPYSTTELEGKLKDLGVVADFA